MPSPSDLLTTPTDIALRSPSIIERPRVVDQGALDQVDAGTSELGRGFTSGLRSSLAASQASVGAALDYAGLRNAASSWYQDAATNAQRAQAAQPFVNDLRSISSPADVPSYVAGKIGEMAPVAIPAIAAGAVGGPIAAAAPFFPLGAGQAVLEHLSPEGKLDQPIQDIAPKALARGAADAVLGGIVPARIAGGVAAAGAKSFLGGIARATVAEPAIQGAAGAGTYATDELIEGRQPTLQGAGEAAAAGAAGILPLAPLSAAFHGVKVNAPEVAPRTGPPAGPPKLLEGPKPSEPAADWAQKVAGGAAPFATSDATDHGRAASMFTSGLRDVDGIDALRARGAEINELAKTYAEKLQADDRVPQETKDRVAASMAAGRPQDEWTTLGRYADALNAAEKIGEPTPETNFAKAHQDVKDLGKDVTEAVSDAKGKNTDEDVKFSMMSSDDRASLSDYVYKNLKDEYKDNPDALAMVKSVTHTLAKLGQFDDQPAPAALTRAVYHVLDDVVQDKGEFIKGLDTNLKQALQGHPESVVTEARDPDSVIGRNLAKTDLTEGGKQLFAQRFEQFMKGEVPDKYSGAAMDAFAQVLGSKDAVRNMLDHYGTRYERGKPEAVLGQEDALPTGEAPKPSFTYAEPGTTRGFTSREGAYAALEKARAADPDFAKRMSVVPMTEAAEEHGGPEALAAKVRADIGDQAAQDKAHANEPVQGGTGTRGDRAAGRAQFLDMTSQEEPGKFLSRFHVIKSEDRTTNDLVASDRDLKAMRTAVEAKDVKGKPEVAQARREGNFQVEFDNGKRLTVNAESVWKSMVAKGLKAQADEGDHAYRSRMFKEGVAAIMARPDVKAVHGADRADLLIDKASGLRYRNMSGSVEVGRALTRRGDIETEAGKFRNKLNDSRGMLGRNRAVDEYEKRLRDLRTEARKAQDPNERRAIEQHIERLERVMVESKEDRAIASGVYDKHEGITDTVKDFAEKEARQEPKARQFETDTGTKVGEGGQAPRVLTSPRAAALDRLVARVKSGDTKGVIEKAQKSNDLNGLQDARSRLIKEARTAKGTEKTHLERTIGALSNRIMDVIGAKNAPSHDVMSQTELMGERATSQHDTDHDEFMRRMGGARRAMDGIKKAAEVLGSQHDFTDLEYNIGQSLRAANRGELTVGDMFDTMGRVIKNLTALRAEGLGDTKMMTELGAKLLAPFDPLTAEQHQHVADIVSKALGDQVKTVVSAMPQLRDAAGSHITTRADESILVNTLMAAVAGAKDVEVTAHHEVMHAVVDRITRDYGIDAIKPLMEAAQQPHIVEQVLGKELTKSRQAYFEKNPEEMLVQAYARWATGDLKLNAEPQLKSFFTRIKDVVKTLLGLLRGDPLLAETFAAAKRGEFAGSKPMDFDSALVTTKARKAEGFLNYSKERPGTKEVTPEERAAAEQEFSRVAGDSIKKAWDDLSGASGKWDPQKDTVTFSKFAADPNSVAWHEALHALFSKLTDPTSRTKLWGSLQRAADSGLVRTRLEKLLANEPEALKQIRTDPQERLAYMFQFHRAGQLRVGPETQNIFGKIAELVRKITGTVSQYDQATKYMDAIYDGKFSDPSLAAKTIEGMRNETLGERIKRLAGPVGIGADKLLTSTTGRLLDTQVPSLVKLADMFHRSPDREEGNKLGFLQERARQDGKYSSEAYGALKGIEAREGLELMRAMRSGDFSGTRGAAMDSLFKKLWTYMDQAGVKRAVTGPDGKVEDWAPLGQIKDYVPQIWDHDAFLRDPQGFEDAAIKAGVPPADAKALRQAVTQPSDHDALNMKAVGLTPFNRSVNKREFHFTPEQLKALEPWLQNDPVKVATTYIQQATHRAEYARTFGNDGAKIKELLARAEKEGATPDELQMATKAVRAMDGTLGADMDPQLRKIASGLIVYENMALLPFALFSSLVDTLGVSLRSGSFADARKAMVEGIKGLVNDVRGKETENRAMARTLGLINESNMLEKFGDTYNGMYMSKMLKNMNDKFFRYNGMESWNKSMRTAAMVAGERFMLKHATRPDEHSERYLRELGIEPSDVKETSDGRIDKSSEKIQRALFKFVDDAVLRPNSAHRPIWGSDPHYNLIYHLKQYSFSYENTFLKRAHHEAEYGNYLPMYMLAAAIPFMDVVDTAQDLLFGGTIHHAAGGLLRAVSRSGVLGTKNFALDAVLDPAYGGVPGQSFLGPAANHAIYASQTLGGHHPASGLFFRSLPAGGLVQGLTS